MSARSALAMIGQYSADDSLVADYHLPQVNGVPGGIRKLMSAILLDGVEAYVNAKLSPIRDKEEYEEACHWVEESDPAYIFSFASVCEGIGIDAHYLKLGLDRYIDSRKAAGKSGGKAAWKKIRRQRTPRQDA
ncbi:MAG: hypothetical protein KC549_06770 [Myxococcales bacterium]|nr:hypothetical protein [Myxococcales bacterium]